MAAGTWVIVSILLGTMACLFIVFRIMTSKKIDTLDKKTAPALVPIVIGPKDTAGKEGSRYRGGKSRDADQETPLI